MLILQNRGHFLVLPVSSSSLAIHVAGIQTVKPPTKFLVVLSTGHSPRNLGSK